MSFSGFSFVFWRIMEIITLIPTLGMLAYFVGLFDPDVVTPRPILILFIVSVLAAAWAIGTLFLYSRAKHSAGFVAFVDLLFLGAFIGAVYELRGITDTSCSRFASYGYFSQLFAPVLLNHRPEPNKWCSMLKACFAFGIMNCIFFFLTFILSLLVHRHWSKKDRVVVKRETHYSRHGHRSRHHSRSPRHSHHSSRRSSHYV